LANSSDRPMSWHKWQIMDDVIALKVFYEDHCDIVVDDRRSSVGISLDVYKWFLLAKTGYEDGSFGA
jgi:hypothetical protein